MNTRSLALAGLIVLAVLTRLLPHPPNFAPITAMAVFGAIRFRNRWWAAIAPLLALLLSDLIREVLYQNGLAQQWGIWRGMWVVYTTTALIVLMGRLAHGTRSPVTIAATTLAGSCVFYVVTNFGVWAGGSHYPHTLEGLGACYIAAIPFFRNGLAGDFFYATVLFGVWAVMEHRYPVLRAAVARPTS